MNFAQQSHRKSIDLETLPPWAREGGEGGEGFWEPKRCPPRIIRVYMIFGYWCDFAPPKIIRVYMIFEIWSDFVK